MSDAPTIIQGGMGVGISDWRLANAVSRAGGLGVVSGTALDELLVRRLQQGDAQGHVRRALAAFPNRALADRLIRTWFVPGGKADAEAYAARPTPACPPTAEWNALCVAANFVEVFLAREGHDGPVGINYLEKIQMPHLPSIYGAMLAGVDYVLMGAGIPMKIPEVLDRYVTHSPATYPLTITGATEPTLLTFNPRSVIPAPAHDLTRPTFLAIVASDVLALSLVRRAAGVVDGFIVESPIAGGHNAPPRGTASVNEHGEPVYGPRDQVDLAKLRALGRPFWLAGGMGSAAGLRAALAEGAAGVQVGTAFALCNESGLRTDLKTRLRASAADGTAVVRTDPSASPTRFPFKVAHVPDTLSDRSVREARPRICDLGYLREAYLTDDGTVGFRCPAEPVNVYVAKGGRAEETDGRVCLCNALVATAGFPQVRSKKHVEPPVVTLGDAWPLVSELAAGTGDYSAADVVRMLRGTAGHLT